MAFQMRKEFKNGLIVEDCYVKISYISGNKEKLYITIQYFKDKAAADARLPHIEEAQYLFVPSTNDDSLRWDKQTYEYLKTLPEFEGAIDVLE